MIKSYFNGKAIIWDEMIVEKNQQKLEEMANRLTIKPGSRILDVGTGTGVFIPFLLDRMGANGQLFAIDIAENMLQRSMCKGFGDKIALIQADITITPLISSFLDVVVCYSAFPHFKNKPLTLLEIFRILKTQGCLYICHTSSRSAINGIHQKISELQHDLLPNADEMQKMLSDCGFVDTVVDESEDSYLVSAVKPIIT